MPEALLQVEDLSVSFRSSRGILPVVDKISFNIYPGEMLALVGESGSGKTISALSLMGLLPAPAAKLEGGRAFFQGRDLFSLSEQQWQSLRGNQLSMIFQEPMTALNPVLSIGFQLAEVLRRHQGLSGKPLRQRCLELLEQVRLPNPEQCLRNYPHQLSGGMRQRVIIAIALACRPKLLIADEPSTALDVTVQAQIMDLLNRLRRESGTAVLFITHNLALVSEYAERCAVMYAGKIVESAPRYELFERGSHPYTRMLLRAIPQAQARRHALAGIEGKPENNGMTACDFAPRCPFAMPMCHEQSPELYRLGDNHELFCHLRGARPELPAPLISADQPEQNINAAAPLLRVNALCVSFPIKGAGLLRRRTTELKAVDGLSFTLEAGETLALVGESGCGKTSVGKALVRLLPIKQGKIILDGETRLEQLSGKQLRDQRGNIQMIFQDPYSSLNPRLSVGESIEEGMLLQRLGRNAAERAERKSELMRLVGLPEHMLSRYPHQFSGGQRQRIVIARALALEPRILVCDECTSALDVSVQAQILNLLQEIQRRKNLAYLFISHDLSVVSYLADRVAVMYLGKIVETGSAEEIFSRARHPYTQALLSAAPKLGGDGTRKLHLEGDVPDPSAPPPGCPFHPRCPIAQELCQRECPPLHHFSTSHSCHCHYPSD